MTVEYAISQRSDFRDTTDNYTWIKYKSDPKGRQTLRILKLPLVSNMFVLLLVLFILNK